MQLLDRIILDNSIKSILIVFGFIILITLSRRILSRYIAALLYIAVSKGWTRVDKSAFIDLIFKPLGWFLTVLISLLAITKLNYPSAWQFSIYEFTMQEIVEKIGVCLVIIYFIRLVRSFIDFIALVLELKSKGQKDKGEDQLIVFFRDFLKTITYIIGLLLLLRAGFNVNISSVLTGLSIVGAALALAAKESIENLIASFIIFFDKPFFTGDTVKMNSVNGVVEHIGLRSTRIRTAEKTLVTVPNKQMVDSVVDNWSKRTERRAEVKIELSHQTSVAKIESFTMKVKSFFEENKADIVKHSVFFTDFNKNSIAITIEYFTQPFSMEEFLEIKQRFNLFVKNIIEEEQIKMASGNDINIFNSDSGEGLVKSSSII